MRLPQCSCIAPGAVEGTKHANQLLFISSFSGFCVVGAGIRKGFFCPLGVLFWLWDGVAQVRETVIYLVSNFEVEGHRYIVGAVVEYRHSLMRYCVVKIKAKTF